MNMHGPIGEAVETLGTRIRRARRAKEWPLDHLAAMLGVSKVSVWNWEADRSRPRVALLEPLSEALGVPVQVLLRGEESPQGGVAAIIADCQNRIGGAVGVRPEDVEIKITFAGAKA